MGRISIRFCSRAYLLTMSAILELTRMRCPGQDMRYWKGDAAFEVACPKCGSPTLLRKGRFGPFLSCKKYPECDGIVNLDKKGCVSPPKTPPLLTDLPCPKCEAPLNLRQGSRGPWLSCSTFPKCRGRLGWSTLETGVKTKWENALDSHEKKHPQLVIHKLDGDPVGNDYRPRTENFDEKKSDETEIGEA